MFRDVTSVHHQESVPHFDTTSVIQRVCLTRVEDKLGPQGMWYVGICSSFSHDSGIFIDYIYLFILLGLLMEVLNHPYMKHLNKNAWELSACNSPLHSFLSFASSLHCTDACSLVCYNLLLFSNSVFLQHFRTIQPPSEHNDSWTQVLNSCLIFRNTAF